MEAKFSIDEFPAMRLFAHEAARILARGEVKNYMSVTMHDDNGNMFELRVQRVEGKTPGKIAEELRAELQDAEWRLSIALEQAKNATAELTALKAAARPIAKFWVGGGIEGVVKGKNQPLDPAYLDELAQLCGEE